MLHENKTFTNSTIELDGHEFKNCRFTGCQFVYRGGKPPTLVNCSFDNFPLTLEGPAADTLRFMAAMYHGGFSSVIEPTFDNIRSNLYGTNWTGRVH